MSDLQQFRSRLAAASAHDWELEKLAYLANERSTLSPWAAWLLVCLIRHHERQQWLAGIMKYRLTGEPETMARAGALQHPSPGRGVVPGEQDWEYRFHGIGCCLTHRVTGEEIDVDFHDQTADWIGRWFYQKYLESLRTPDFPELRLMQLHAHLETLEIAVHELLDAGAIVSLNPERPGGIFKLSAESLKLVEFVNSLNQRLVDPTQRVTAALILGDWQNCAAQFDNPKLTDSVAQQWAVSCEQREILLRELFAAEELRPAALYGLCDLGSEFLEPALHKALQESPKYLTSVALTIIEEQSEQNWQKQIIALFTKLDPNGEAPEPLLFIRGAKYLLQRNYNTEIIWQSFKRLQDRRTGDAALLALEYNPLLARPLFQRALRSTIPCERTTAAAALAILDEPWCLDELIQVLNDSTKHDENASIRAALWASTRPQAHQAVSDWEELHPRIPEQGPWITMKEVTIRHADSWMNWEMEKLHTRVLPWRGRVS